MVIEEYSWRNSAK